MFILDTNWWDVIAKQGESGGITDRRLAGFGVEKGCEQRWGQPAIWVQGEQVWETRPLCSNIWKPIMQKKDCARSLWHLGRKRAPMGKSSRKTRSLATMKKSCLRAQEGAKMTWTWPGEMVGLRSYDTLGEPFKSWHPRLLLDPVYWAQDCPSLAILLSNMVRFEEFKLISPKIRS